MTRTIRAKPIKCDLLICRYQTGLRLWESHGSKKGFFPFFLYFFVTFERTLGALESHRNVFVWSLIKRITTSGYSNTRLSVYGKPIIFTCWIFLHKDSSYTLYRAVSICVCVVVLVHVGVCERLVTQRKCWATEEQGLMSRV